MGDLAIFLGAFLGAALGPWLLRLIRAPFLAIRRRREAREREEAIARGEYVVPFSWMTAALEAAAKRRQAEEDARAQASAAKLMDLAAKGVPWEEAKRQSGIKV